MMAIVEGAGRIVSRDAGIIIMGAAVMIILGGTGMVIIVGGAGIIAIV
jgi:hypothetical protein